MAIILCTKWLIVALLIIMSVCVLAVTENWLLFNAHAPAIIYCHMLSMADVDCHVWHA